MRQSDLTKTPEAPKRDLRDGQSAVVLAAGYSWHEKSFHTMERDGLPSYLFRLQMEGPAQALVNNEMVTLKEGDLLLYAPGEPYELSINLDSGQAHSLDYFLFCSGSWIDAWWAQMSRQTLIHLPTDESIVTLWQQIITDRKTAAFKDTSSLISDYLLRALCLVVDRVILEYSSGTRNTNTFVAHRMKRFIEQNAATAFTVEDVARHVGLSVSRTVHLFKETFSQSLMGYALDVRLNMACERIRFGTMSLEQAAASAGFGSYSYFHRAFKARFGITPRAYRIT